MNNITKKQHYIPKSVLKNHTSFLIPMTGPKLYQYDKVKNIEHLVSTKDICTNKCLYEFRATNNNIVSCNFLENLFSSFENQQCQILQKCLKKQLLKEDEKTLLYFFVTFQILRTPSALKFTSSFLKNNSSNNDVNFDTAAKYLSLPHSFFKNQSGSLFLHLFNFISHKKLEVCFSNAPFLLGDDIPIISFDTLPNSPIYFPFSSSACIKLTSTSSRETKFYSKISKEEQLLVNHEIFDLQNRFVYCVKSFKFFNFLSENRF